MAIYKPYPKYKNSNIPWLGEIPEHWRNWKIARGANLIGSGTTPNSGNKEYYENGTINWLNTGDFNDSILKYCKRKVTKKAVEENSALKLFPKGTLSIAMYGATIGKVCIVDFDTTTNQACCNIVEGDIFDNKFLMYWFIGNKKHIVNLSYGGGQPNISQDVIKQLIVPSPKKQEQSAIARFLDYKLAKINRFIRKKKQLIKLLNEQKAAIINQAVTKGLDPNVKMKDSGIEWLGEIPEHWEKHKLKYLISKPIAGAWGTEPQNDDNDITCVRVADFSEYEIKTNNLTIRNIEAKTEQILKPGDLLLEKSGGGEKTPVGRVVLFNQSFKAVTSNFVSKFSPKIDLVSSEYLLYIFKLINIVRWNFRSLKQTTGIQNIDTYQYMDNWVFIPKIEEQKIIVNHIKSEFKILDETITKIEKEIALVEEYKTALIAEAVTGKIDVRGYEVPEVLEEETYEEIEDPDSYRDSMAAEDAAEYENESDL